MVVLAIFVSVIAGTVILSGSISHGLKEIKKELSGIKSELIEFNEYLSSFEEKKDANNEHHRMIKEQLESLKKILARNFRIAMHDEEFENL